MSRVGSLGYLVLAALFLSLFLLNAKGSELEDGLKANFWARKMLANVRDRKLNIILCVRLKCQGGPQMPEDTFKTEQEKKIAVKERSSEYPCFLAEALKMGFLVRLPEIWVIVRIFWTTISISQPLHSLGFLLL
ncbi:unnamed protein product [Spirodela intermedia]|uniref:Uncharacterized protein n=1 Tax=Spirodela intermedia TaxID=51605 RepID=A0A7I8KC45_SPIIN|nr:unnamed protein product [Spirodela intermedia]